MQVFGDPNTMALMASQFMRTASLGTAADGLLRTLPPKAQELLGQMASAVVSQLDPKTTDVPAATPEPVPSGNGTPANVGR
jgi:hypothetical protein